MDETLFILGVRRGQRSEGQARWSGCRQRSRAELLVVDDAPDELAGVEYATELSESFLRPLLRLVRADLAPRRKQGPAV